MYYHNLDSFEDWDAHMITLGSKLRSLSEKVKKAIRIVETHHDQPRIFTQGNYNRHLLRVARILAEEMNVIDETTILISLCHDLGEWSTYDIKNLSTEFDEEVYKGVKVLTWDQKGNWSDFVDSIAKSNIKNLVQIKIADKLDNNRALALSRSSEEKQKAIEKTKNSILPLVQNYCPEMRTAYDEVLLRLKST